MTVTSLTMTEPPERAIEHGIDIRLSRGSGPPLARVNEPVTFGVPFPQGAVRVDDVFELRDREGHSVPTDTRVLDRWRDGSVRWLLVDAQVSGGDGRADVYRLQKGRPVARPDMQVREDGEAITITTGRTRFTVRAGSASPLDVLVDGHPALNVTASAMTALDMHGQPCRVAFDRVRLEESGSLRVSTRIDGAIHGTNGERIAELLVRLHFFAGSPSVRMLVRVRNPRRAEHPNGFWDLGDRGSVFLKDLSLQLSLSDTGATVRCSTALDRPFEPAEAPFALYQDSSGGDNWASSNHINRDRVVPNTFRGYRLRSGPHEASGLRASPILSVETGRTRVAVTLPHFWQNFPKRLSADAGTLAVGLFPGEYADVHELQGGEQKTHELFLSFAPDGITAEPLAWARQRLVVHASPEWYRDAEAMPYLSVGRTAASDPIVRLVAAAVDGPDTFERKREVIDQYGWRHFGDVYGDHEAVRDNGPTPLVSHYNNQYDTAYGFARQFLRTGDTRWWTQYEELVAHVVDIDIYHTVEDKWAYNHGLFWHTYHYGDADTANHRTYPASAAGKTHGGGPSAEHNYTSGLMLYYFLTGDRDAKQTAIDLGQFVIDADDGTRTIFRWLDRGPTGLVSASGTVDYHGPGRGPANAVNALLDAFRLSGDRKYLDKAEQLIRRSVHPRDDIAARDLLDAERKWFYTMFLQTLGKYLDDKISRNELDEMYAYGQGALLHYARWMAEHERPTLDTPERLEFPTETWAAQDIRKSDVFHYAAKHAQGAERDRFLERADFFFRYSTSTLLDMPTRTLARPVIVLLSSGWLHPWTASRAEHAPPGRLTAETAQATAPAFVPQKQRVRRRLRMLGIAGVVGVAGTILLLLFG